MNAATRHSVSTPAKKVYTKPHVRKLAVTEEILELFRSKDPIRLVVDRLDEPGNP